MAKKTDQDIIQELEKAILPEKGQRDEYEQSWLLNYLFFNGFHWIDASGGALRNFNNDVRFRANMIRMGVTHSVAKAMSNPPDFDVENESSDSESEASSHVGEKFLEYIWRAEGLQIKCKEWAMSARIHAMPTPMCLGTRTREKPLTRSPSFSLMKREIRWTSTTSMRRLAETLRALFRS